MGRTKSKTNTRPAPTGQDWRLRRSSKGVRFCPTRPFQRWMTCSLGRVSSSSGCWKRRSTTSCIASANSAGLNGVATARATYANGGRSRHGRGGVRLPRVSDVPQEVAPGGFHSAIVERYQRRSKTQARLLCRLYLGGLASGDFEPVFRALVERPQPCLPTRSCDLRTNGSRNISLETQAAARALRVRLRRRLVRHEAPHSRVGWRGANRRLVAASR